MVTHEGGPIPRLSTAPRIGVLGDLHGELGHALYAAEMFSRRGVKVMMQTGDFGFVLGAGWERTVDKLARRLAAMNQLLLFADGNHEDFTILESLPISPEDGLRWIRPGTIAHMPRGWRTVLGRRWVLAVLGGANSIDLMGRVVGKDFWVREQINDEDLERLGTEEADILIGHDAPLFLPSLDAHLASLPRWTPEAEHYAAEGRRRFHQGFLNVRPGLYIGGHYHTYIDERLPFGTDDHSFTTRVVLLDMNGAERVNVAELDTWTLHLTPLLRDGTEASWPSAARKSDDR
jgi:hypothetical protein